MVDLRRAGLLVCRFELEDGRWVDDATVALAVAAGSRCDGLLADDEVVV